MNNTWKPALSAGIPTPCYVALLIASLILGSNNVLAQTGASGLGTPEETGNPPSHFTDPNDVFVAGRGNRRIQIFDQASAHLDTGYQFSRIRGLFIDDNDVLYAIDSESDDNYNPGWHQGLRVGSAITVKVWYVVPEYLSHRASGIGWLQPNG